METNEQRPQILNYRDPVDYMRDMLEFKRSSEDFSVLRATQKLRKISPALISLILKKKRKITLDRVDELAKLLNLNGVEKLYFKDWILISESKDDLENKETEETLHRSISNLRKSRKEVSTHILNDRLNVYVKDSFQIPAISKNPDLVFKHLAAMASRKRVQASLQFLLREGYLRKTPEGFIVVETNLTTTDPNISHQKIKQFHKGALNLAKNAIDLFPANERYANTFLIPLTTESYSELIGLIQEFAETLKDFSETRAAEGDKLHQIIVNVSPTGGTVT